MSPACGEVRADQRRASPSGYSCDSNRPPVTSPSERLWLAAHVPAVSAHVAELAAGPEAELVAVAFDDRVDGAQIVQAHPGPPDGGPVVAGQPGHQVDPGQLAEAQAGSLVGDRLPDIRRRGCRRRRLGRSG